MQHRIEVAPSGRASCKTCGNTIAKGELRLGEEYASQFGSDGVAIRWHHLACAAAKIPAILGEAMQSFAGEIPNREALEATMRGEAKSSEGTPVAPKKTGAGGLPNADLAPTGRAKCIQCGEAIAKGTVRIAVEREVDTGSFTTKGAGYMHPACVETWASGEWAAGLDDLIERVKTNTSLDALPPPFGAAADAANASPEPAATAKKKAKVTKAAPASEASDFGTMSAKTVASIVAKLAKLKDDYKGDDVLEKAGVDWPQRDPLRWHIARTGLLPVTHPTLLNRLDNSAKQASADDVFGAIARLDAPAKDYSEVLKGWTICEDRIVLRGYELDPARLESLVESAVPRVRTGIQFVRGRHGAALPDSDREKILVALASAEAADYGMSRSHSASGPRLSVIVIGADGKDAEPFNDAIDIARRFGTDEQWFAALEKATRAGKFQTLQRVIDGLVRMPLGEMVSLLASMFYGSGEGEDRYFATIIARRAETPAALVEAALRIERDSHPGGTIRERLLMHALAEMGKQGLAVPDGLENELKWDKVLFSMPPWRGSAPERELAVAAIRAVPADRALARVKPMTERGWGETLALPFLAVHHDDALLRKVIASKDGVGDPGMFAPFGARVFDPLREALAPLGESPEDEKRRQQIKDSIVAAMAFEAMSGRSFDASLDAFVNCNPASPYWSEESRKQLKAILEAMPEARRIATLERLFEDTKQVERPFFLAHTVADPAYREKSARRLVQRFASVSDRSTMQLGLKEYGPNGLDSFRAALLEGTPDTKIFTELKYVFGDKPVTELMKAGNVVEEKPFARMLRLAREKIAAGAKSTRIYLLERRDLDANAPAARNGSFSFSRGKGPAIDRAALSVPSEHEHIITIDFEDVPELAAARPGARAIALYSASPNHGDEWGGSRLVDVPIGATAPGDGTPLSVVPLDVPRDIFDSSRTAEDTVLKELRGLVFNRPGYVLGEPMFIQDDEDDGSGFVMQLASQIGDLNLGDSGSLYVFDSGTFMQCY